jgi:NADH-quinone oxidoreductase subunit J
MSLPFLLFFAFALVAVLGAVLLILAKEPIHSALSLILVMIALAVLYLLLGAEFVAAIQIIVYAGAVMVLFVFVIMLLNAGVRSARIGAWSPPGQGHRWRSFCSSNWRTIWLSRRLAG